MNVGLMFSRQSDLWTTPVDLFNALNAEFGFTVDAAANTSNHLCLKWYGPGGDHEDALLVEWGGTCWLNPPYSKCREFVAKAAEQRLRGVTTVMLVPARTDTRWWHDHVWDRTIHQFRLGVEVRFLKGRLKFGGVAAGAPFPSVLVIFRG